MIYRLLFDALHQTRLYIRSVMAACTDEREICVDELRQALLKMAENNPDEELKLKTDTLISDVLAKKLVSSYDLARGTVSMLKDIVESRVNLPADELKEVIKSVGKKLSAALPDESIVKNMVQRVHKIILDDSTNRPDGENQESLQNFVPITPASPLQHQQVSVHGLHVAISDSINQLLNELESSAYNIAAQAPTYIHKDDVILTSGKSKTVLAFLKEAATKITFSVIVLEHEPECDGHEMAAELAEAKIPTTIIPDASVFAVMPRVSKVVLGTDVILANGGLKAATGSNGIALTAKHYAKPVLVCAAMFKLSREYANQESFNKMESSQSLLDYSEAEDKNLIVLNPAFDYVPPDLITTLISNIGGNTPSYFYRLLHDLYPAEECLE